MKDVKEKCKASLVRVRSFIEIRLVVAVRMQVGWILGSKIAVQRTSVRQPDEARYLDTVLECQKLSQ